MAMKRCPDCGEKYSDSYKYCPFCEEEEILKEGKDRGRRRSRRSREFSLLTPVLIVLILVMAGLLMFLLRSDKQPTEPVTPQPGVETPVEPGTDTEPGSTDSDGTDSTDPGTMPDEPDSNTPSTPTTPDTSSDTSAAGSEATIVNAATGVNVRPDASTNGAAIASLKNGDKVQVVRDAGNVDNSTCVLLIGCTDTYMGLNHCSMCGFANCGETKKHGSPCIFNVSDLGIAVGSAVSATA